MKTRSVRKPARRSKTRMEGERRPTKHDAVGQCEFGLVCWCSRCHTITVSFGRIRLGGLVGLDEYGEVRGDLESLIWTFGFKSF